MTNAWITELKKCAANYKAKKKGRQTLNPSEMTAADKKAQRMFRRNKRRAAKAAKRS